MSVQIARLTKRDAHPGYECGELYVIAMRSHQDSAKRIGQQHEIGRLLQTAEVSVKVVQRLRIAERELGAESLDGFLQTKTVVLRY